MVSANKIKHEGLKAEVAPSADVSPDATGLSLLGAVSFSMTFSTLTWSDEPEAARLIHAPVHRIPKSPEAFNSWLGGEARRIRDTACESLTRDGDAYEVTYPADGFDGAQLWIEERGQRISGEGGRSDLILGVLRDITDARHSEMNLAWSAHHDPVTKLWNRARFTEALVYEMAASELRSEAGYVAALRLTGVEDINTNISYDAGDHLLTQIAALLRERLRSPNSVARINNAEFACLLPGVTSADAGTLIKDIAEEVSSSPHPSPYGELYTECEVSGLPLTPGQDAGNRLAMLESQLQPLTDGVDFPLITFSGPDVTTFQATPDKITASDILAVLNERRIAMAYQPIIDAKTRKVNHFECLMRIVGDDGEPRSA